MAHTDRIQALTVETQRTIGRLAERDYGLTLKRISMDSGIPYGSVRNYFSQAHNAPLAELPLSAFIKLIGVIPDRLLSQLLDPADRHLAQNEDDDSELDDLADVADAVAREVRRARHPHSPGGTEIITVEEDNIKQLARGLRRAAA
jgi:hypothetical protein